MPEEIEYGDSKVARREYLLPEQCHSRKNWLPLNITKILKQSRALFSEECSARYTIYLLAR